MNAQLPTLTSAEWTVAALVDSFKATLSKTRGQATLRIFTYAVTASGWRELQKSVRNWLANGDNRNAIAYVGTDHAMTDPDALRHMQSDGVEVRLMVEYIGVFHPKVIWLSSDHSHNVWVGSNNLTEDGLLRNIEFATLIASTDLNPQLKKWFNVVHKGSTPLTEELLNSYEVERRDFADRRAQTGTFTWSQRKEPPPPPPNPVKPLPHRPIIIPATGDLVVEVMPRETGLDGKQLQLPIAAATTFFLLPDAVGSSRQVTLTPVGNDYARTLTMTIFKNNTTRLSINELDYRDRPCVIIFRRLGRAEFSFEIVRRSIYPDRYRNLLERCNQQTRSGSRRWGVL